MFTKSNKDGYRDAFDKVSFKTLAWGDNTSLGLFRLAKGALIPEHHHHNEQTGYLVSGKMIFNIGGESYTAKAGDSWSIPGNVKHWVEAVEDCVVIEVFSPAREDYLPEEN